MINWLKEFFTKESRSSFAKCDWLTAESSWRQVELLSQSSSQADKKQAIIEADNIIAKIMLEGNVRGANFGERLKNLRNRLDRQVYRNLWKAHLKRNELVHEAGSFVADWELKIYLSNFKEGMDELRKLR